jgi:phosphomannomutase
MEFDDRIFKANDIRGTYPDQLNAAFAFALGVGVVKCIGARRVLAGRDCRIGSAELHAAFVAGVKSAGAQADSADLCPIEVIFYLMGARREHDVAAMVTASHNPPEYNGFKLLTRGGAPLDSKTGLARLHKWLAETDVAAPNQFHPPPKTVEAEDEYMRLALRVVGAPHVRDLKVVVDAGNGVGGLLWRRLAEATGLRPIEMNFEPDGRFPSHNPNPAKRENLRALRERVLAEKADLGFAYDGDADRTVAVLGDGHIIDGSEMIVVLLDSLFADTGSVRCAVCMVTSRKTIDYVRARGEEPLIVPVGEARVRRAMEQDRSVAFAGEQSGHYLYREFFCCDSSLITTLHVLRLAASGRLRSVIAQIPGPWFQPAMQGEMPFSRRSEALARCRAVARAGIAAFPGFAEIMCEEEGRVRRRCSPDDIERADGVRVEYDDWWFASRPSGTEPIARLTVEARTQAAAEERLAALRRLFDAA